jgi:quinol monooxygenase YgiN
MMPPKLGFLVTLQARAGREEDVAAFLVAARELVEAEPGTRTWAAFRSGESTFGIFDTFDSEPERDAHLHGEVRQALESRADLFGTPPIITAVDILASKRQP